MRLLVIDDHNDCRIVAARLLACLGHEVIEVASGPDAEAIMRSEAHRIDMLLVDLFLQEGDGVKLAAKLERQHPGVRILFMSGDGVTASRNAELSGPRRHFLEKPFTLPRLEAAVACLAARS